MHAGLTRSGCEELADLPGENRLHLRMHAHLGLLSDDQVDTGTMLEVGPHILTEGLETQSNIDEVLKPEPVVSLGKPEGLTKRCYESLSW